MYRPRAVYPKLSTQSCLPKAVYPKLSTQSCLPYLTPSTLPCIPCLTRTLRVTCRVGTGKASSLPLCPLQQCRRGQASARRLGRSESGRWVLLHEPSATRAGGLRRLSGEGSRLRQGSGQVIICLAPAFHPSSKYFRNTSTLLEHYSTK